MLAYEQTLDDRLDRILVNIRESVPGEFGMLAQVIAILKED